MSSLALCTTLLRVLSEEWHSWHKMNLLSSIIAVKRGTIERPSCQWRTLTLRGKGHPSLAQPAQGQHAIILCCIFQPVLILIIGNSITPFFHSGFHLGEDPPSNSGRKRKYVSQTVAELSRETVTAAKRHDKLELLSKDWKHLKVWLTLLFMEGFEWKYYMRIKKFCNLLSDQMWNVLTLQKMILHAQ